MNYQETITPNINNNVDSNAPLSNSSNGGSGEFGQEASNYSDGSDTRPGLENVEEYEPTYGQMASETNTFSESFEADDPPLQEAFLGSFPEESFNAVDGQIMERVIGRDDRVPIRNTTGIPWRTICQLSIEAKNGQRYLGTGWFIGPRTIITAGHCVFLRQAGGWAKSITVTPGKNGNSKPFGTCVARDFRSVGGWVRSGDKNYDYGAIILPPNCKQMGSRVGAFQFRALDNNSIKGKFLNLAGYPGDKGGKTMWYHARKVTQAQNQQLFYDIDTAGGQSGAPLWLKMPNGVRVAVGIHTTGGTNQNSATRINPAVHSNLTRWRNEGQ